MSFFPVTFQAMKLVHAQTVKHSNTLKKPLKSHVVKICLANTCSVLLNIIYTTACFVE